MAELKGMWELLEQEKEHILSEMLQVKGLRPLLMKPRNQQKWTVEDRAELKQHRYNGFRFGSLSHRGRAPWFLSAVTCSCLVA